MVSLGQPITNDGTNKERRIIGSMEQTTRFEWDYRDMINRLYFENGWKIGKKVLNNAGISFLWEPYEGPFSMIQGAALADLSMGEFWTHSNGMIDAGIPAARPCCRKNNSRRRSLYRFAREQPVH
ncbi:MAG: hypothetical protein AB2L24_09615 [Mangrovibacterium sp.]